MPFLLLATSPEQAIEPVGNVSYTLTVLNNAVEAISASDACLHRHDLTELKPLEDRINAARRRAMAVEPTLAGIERAGVRTSSATQTRG